jgi:hypothetical protein
MHFLIGIKIAIELMNKKRRSGEYSSRRRVSSCSQKGIIAKLPLREPHIKN